jgi:hypothetical protein
MAEANFDRVAEGVKTYFTTAIPVALRAIEKELADGVTLPDPKLHTIGYPTTFRSTDYPVDSYVAGQTGHEFYMQSEVIYLDVDVIVAMVGSQPENLEKICLRYGDALCNAVRADRSLGAICDVAWVTSVQWGHPGGDDKQHAAVMATVRMQNEVLG